MNTVDRAGARSLSLAAGVGLFSPPRRVRPPAPGNLPICAHILLKLSAGWSKYLDMRDSLGHVLLVDDDELTLEALRRGLSREARIETVTTAAEAAHLAARKSFAVVVTDIVMPGMNGLELIETLRVVSPDTVCVVLSGRVDHPYPRGLPSNVLSCLAKPCGMMDLVDTIHSALAEYVLRSNRDQVLR